MFSKHGYVFYLTNPTQIFLILCNTLSCIVNLVSTDCKEKIFLGHSFYFGCSESLSPCTNSCHGSYGGCKFASSSNYSAPTDRFGHAIFSYLRMDV